MAGSDEGGQAGTVGADMSAAQCRAARGLLGWSQGELAGKAGLGEDVVRAFEAGHGDPPSGRIEVLRSALMQAGAVFTGGAEAGVRLGNQPGGDEGTRLDALTTENDR